MSCSHFILHSLIVAVFVTVANSACYNNLTACVSDFRQLLLDTDKFWFGNSYEKNCPNRSETLECGNSHTDRRSILSRLLALNDSDPQDWEFLNSTVQQLTLANITFTAPAGNYTGCGQVYQAEALNNYLVDPLDITRISSWSLQRTPKVTWVPESANTTNILIIWDPGNYYNHGLYVNCVNGSLDYCQSVKNYFGPLNTHLRANTYIFAVYKQSTTINLDEAKKFIENSPYLNPARFIAQFTSANYSFPQHAGAMTIVADPFSVQKINDRFFLSNNCPFLISQLDVARAMVTASGLDVQWSDNATSMSLFSNNTYLRSLKVNIDVRYHTDDFSVVSCCTNYSITRGSVVVNPFSNETIRPANVRIKPNIQLSAMDLMEMDSLVGDTYTLFMLDVAPAVLNPGASNITYVTHWLVTNIQTADVVTGDEVAEYFGPNPFTPNQRRPYMFLLLKQPVAKLNNTIFSTFCPNGNVRCMIQLKSVLEAWNMTEIVGMTWFTAEQDAFARYRFYDVLKFRSKDTICQGLPGYAEPCPSVSPCPGNKGNNHGEKQKMNIAILAFLAVVYFVATYV